MNNIEDIKKKNPFKVPENYFEKVNRKIIASTVEADPLTKPGGIYRKLRPVILVAASVSILALLTYTGIRLLSEKEEFPLLSEIKTDEYTEILLNEIDLSALEESAADAGLPNLEPKVDNQEIVDYLIMDNIDINLLEEQL